MDLMLLDNERLDDLYLKGYEIIQNPKMFCFGVDAVLLSDFALASEEDRVLDMGTGNGVIPLLLHGKYQPKHITGLEIQEANVHMAGRSVAHNHLEDQINIIHGDIKEADSLLPLSAFDLVTCNPPYMDSGKGLTNDLSAKTIARHEVLCSLEDVIRSASRLVRVGGRFCMVHRPHRLVDIIDLLRQYKLEPKRLRMVHSYVDAEPNMVLIEAVRHGRPMIKIAPPLIVYKEKNVYTDEIMRIYGYDQDPNFKQKTKG